jgi:hypothetical protein
MFYVIVPMVIFYMMVCIGQFEGYELFLLYSLPVMVTIPFGMIMQHDVNRRKDHVKDIFGK